MEVYLYNYSTDTKDHLGETPNIPLPMKGDYVTGDRLQGKVKALEYHYGINKIFICI